MKVYWAIPPFKIAHDNVIMQKKYSWMSFHEMTFQFEKMQDVTCFLSRLCRFHYLFGPIKAAGPHSLHSCLTNQWSQYRNKPETNEAATFGLHACDTELIGLAYSENMWEKLCFIDDSVIY